MLLREAVEDSRMKDSADRYIVPVAAKTLDILEAFRSPDDDLTLQEVIDKTGVAHATAFRILYTLVHRGYLTRHQNRYRLPKVRQKPKIGYAILSDDVAISVAVGESLRKAAAAAGMEVLILNNEETPENAIKNAHRFAAEKVSVVIEFQNDSEVAPVIADILATAGIPAIALHIPQPGAVYFGPDNYRAGWTAGTALAEHAISRWRGRFDRVLLMDIQHGGPTLRSRMTGVLAGLENAMGPAASDKVIRLSSGKTREKSRQVVAASLAEQAKAQRIMISAVSDDNALAALEAVREMGLRRNCVIVGHDGSEEALEAIAEPGSPFIGTVAFFPEQYGRQLTDLTTRMLRGDAVPPAVYIPHQLITARNVRQFAPGRLKSAAQGE